MIDQRSPTLKGRLTQQIASEQLPRLHVALLQVTDQVRAAERGAIADGEKQPEPGGVGVCRRLGQVQELLVARHIAQALRQSGDRPAQATEAAS